MRKREKYGEKEREIRRGRERNTARKREKYCEEEREIRNTARKRERNTARKREKYREEEREIPRGRERNGVYNYIYSVFSK